MNEIITVIPTGLNCHSHKKYINICKFTQKCNKNRGKLGVLETLSLKTLISWEKKPKLFTLGSYTAFFP